MIDTADAELTSLHGDLKLLKEAIVGEDHAGAAQILATHDLRLRSYIETHGTGNATTALNSLLEEQEALSTLMKKLREEAAVQLRAERQSTRAVGAYQQAGTLA